jgi:RNA recognition motif-containing protein
MIGQVKQYTMFVDDKGEYTGTMAVAFVHPSDVRRAYQTCDGMFFEGKLQLWHQAEVAYYINGQRFYQKEEEPPAPVEVSQPTDETSADGLFQPTSDSMDDVRDDVISPPAASFVDTSRKVPDEYLIISNLPTSVDGAEIVNHIEIMIDCDVAHYNMFADDKGQYSGSMIVDFVHPSDARRAYKLYDGLLLEGNAIQVAYFINGQRSYQKEEDELVPTATDGVCVADLIDASPTIDHAPEINVVTPEIIVPEALAVHQQETLPGATTEDMHQSTHLDDPVVDKNLVEESLSCEINPILMTRKLKINKKTARRKKAKKNREAAASSSAE